MENKKPKIKITYSENKLSPEEERNQIVKALSILFSVPMENCNVQE